MSQVSHKIATTLSQGCYHAQGCGNFVTSLYFLYGYCSVMVAPLGVSPEHFSVMRTPGVWTTPVSMLNGVTSAL